MTATEGAQQWGWWIAEATVWGVLVFGALDSAGQTVQCLLDGGKPQFMAACKFDEPVKLRHDAHINHIEGRTL